MNKIWKWLIKYHHKGIVAMNERSNYDILEPKVWERQNGERSLEHEVWKFQNLNKKCYKGMIRELEDVNSKLDVKIRK
jgi:hypothetical protein